MVDRDRCLCKSLFCPHTNSILCDAAKWNAGHLRAQTKVRGIHKDTVREDDKRDLDKMQIPIWVRVSLLN